LIISSKLNGQLRLDPQKPRSSRIGARLPGKESDRDMTKISSLSLDSSSGWVEFIGDVPERTSFAPYFLREERLSFPQCALRSRKNFLSARDPTAAGRLLSPAALRGRIVSIDERFGPARGADHPGSPLAMAEGESYAQPLDCGAHSSRRCNL